MSFIQDIIDKFVLGFSNYSSQPLKFKKIQLESHKENILPPKKSSFYVPEFEFLLALSQPSQTLSSGNTQPKEKSITQHTNMFQYNGYTTQRERID